ncbi:MAG: hypothetical protein GX755_06075 [Syntrophomonadaceae bacterium]|mgnify:FL=1|nr:hypothetical protein [Syntrophomonadaceae bacterium]
MSQEKILVEVYDGASIGGCCSCSGCSAEGSCGPAESVAETTAVLARELAQSFGAGVEVKFIDTKDKGIQEYAQLWPLLRNGYRFPFVFIKGEPRMAGGISVEKIKELIEKL